MGITLNDSESQRALRLFYKQYEKTKTFFLNSLNFSEKRLQMSKNFDLLMLQLLNFSFLQEKRVLNDDVQFFSIKFRELLGKYNKRKMRKKGKNTYSYRLRDYLASFLDKLINNRIELKSELDIKLPTHIMKYLVVIDPAELTQMNIPDVFIFQEELLFSELTQGDLYHSEYIPLMNLSTLLLKNGDIKSFFLGAIFENMINDMDRKRMGAYYTPEPIASYICKEAIDSLLLKRLNNEFGNQFLSVEELIQKADENLLISLINSILQLKILDPAVGSAHFLCSVSDYISELMVKIWKKDENLLEKCIGLPHSSSRDPNFLKFILKTDFIIPDILFGVDINPASIMISKSRLVLSLLGDLDHLDDISDVLLSLNHISFNLKVGNSLIGFISPENEELIYCSKSEINRYFSEYHKITKDSQLENQSFHWFLEFPDLFSKRKNFDIIIGNPPYYSTDPKYKFINDIESAIFKTYDVYHGQADILVYFFERAFHLCAPDGVIGFISKNRWQDAYTYEPFVRFLVGKNMKIIDFDEELIFQGIGVTTNIIFIEKQGKPQVTYLLYNNGDSDEILNWNNYECHVSNSTYNKIRYPLKDEITDYLDRKAQDIKIESGYGHKLTPKKLFHLKRLEHKTFEPHSQEIKKKYPLIELEDHEMDYVFPYISSGRIFPYYVRKASHIFYLKDTNLKTLSNIHDYFTTVGSKKENPRYYQYYYGKGFRNTELIRRKEKIIYPARQYQKRKGSFFYDNIGFIIGMDCGVATSNDPRISMKFLTVILNSALMWYYFTRTFKKYKNRQTVDLQRVPITVPSQKDVFEIIAEYLLFLNSDNSKRKRFRNLISYFHYQIADLLVFELYFQSKFREAEIYSDHCTSFYGLVKKNTKKIDFRKWSKLYWQFKLDHLNDDPDSDLLARLESQNLRMIRDAYELLVANKEIMDISKRIKKYPWVDMVQSIKRI